MRILICSAIFFLVASCGSRKDVVSTKSENILIVDSLPTACAKLVLSELQNLQSLGKNCFVTPALARRLSPEATANKTDDAIKTEMINPLTMRFSDNMQRLREAAVKNGINVAELKFKGVDLPPSTDPPLVARAFYIELTHVDQEFRIPMTAIQADGVWYLLEILMTTGVFGTD